MKKIFITIIFLPLFYASISMAEQKVEVDNWDIQQYKGQIGRWELVESKDYLYYYAKKYSISLKVIYDLNNKFSDGDYIFIPYSKEYLNKLHSTGIKRNTVNIKSDNDLIWPVEGIEKITSTFGMRWGQFHDGVDLPKRKGTPVIAAIDGRVVSVGYFGGYGNTVVLEGRNNIHTRYSHNSVLLVKKGEFVRKGQVIALLGSTGNSTGNHLHFELRYKDIPLNPLDFLPYIANIEFIPFSKD